MEIFLMKSVFVASCLHIIAFINGERLFNPRIRIPTRFSARSIIQPKPLRLPLQGIPSFLNEELSWMYTNTEKIISEPTPQPIPTVKSRQYSQKGKVFGYCDIGNDEDLDHLFPGMFQTESEILSETKNVIKKDRWYGNTIRTYGPAKPKLPAKIETTPKSLARTNNASEVLDSQRPLNNMLASPVCQCCQTISAHEVYRNITVDNKTYDVIQLPGKFQAIPVGRCPEINLCLHGGCVQHYTVHNVLIWNDTVPYYPPFDFAMVEYPTHCTWENIGK